ncbi:hypothetical protein [Legionella beliardensis]|nr:hypothetical protein [Legionella beliardensis]
MPISSIKEPGSYYSSAISLSEKARKNAVHVAVGEFELLRVDKQGCIWTDSLQSCFPAVFKFKNGDIGMLHANSATIRKILPLLDRSDLEEIQVFEKGQEFNSQKVGGFIENVINHYQQNKQLTKPRITIQIQEHIAPYGVAVCYKSPDNQPIIIVGESNTDGSNSLALTLNECTNSEDFIRQYEFEDAAERFGIVLNTVNIPAPTPSAENSHRFLGGKKKNKWNDEVEIESAKKIKKCTIL